MKELDLRPRPLPGDMLLNTARSYSDNPFIGWEEVQIENFDSYKSVAHELHDVLDEIIKGLRSEWPVTTTSDLLDS